MTKYVEWINVSTAKNPNKTTAREECVTLCVHMFIINIIVRLQMQDVHVEDIEDLKEEYEALREDIKRVRDYRKKSNSVFAA